MALPSRGTSGSLTLYGEIEAIEEDVRGAAARAELEGKSPKVLDHLRQARESLQFARWQMSDDKFDESKALG